MMPPESRANGKPKPAPSFEPPPRRWNRVAWKLSVVVIGIVTLVIASVGVVNNIISKNLALESARAVLRFNSDTMVGGINDLMMSRNNQGVLEFIQDVSESSTFYRDIRLVSHHSGEVVVSRHSESTGIKLNVKAHSCALCHIDGEPALAPGRSLDEVIEGRGGNRVLYVTTPIANRPSCRNAACHVHADGSPILGFLQSEYSLDQIDSLIFGISTSFVIAALVAIILGTMALWLMFETALARPIRALLKGIRALARDNLAFRFKTDRKDEFGLVGRSFNQMAARLQWQQNELRYATEYLEGIVENSADIIITVNLKGRIETANRGAEMALGYRKDEMIGQPIEMLFADPRERDAAIAKLQDQDNVTNLEVRFLTKNKEERIVLLTMSRLRDRDGTAIGTFGISKDITTRRHLQGQLNQAEKAAAIGQAATSIQHAIKNMLNTLAGGSYLARVGIEKGDEERVQDGMAMIDEGISRIKELSTNMLGYARTWKMERADIDLRELLRGISTALRQPAEDKGVEMRYEVAEDLPPAYCDPRLIHMALMDIATNALDACHMKEYEAGETATVSFRVHSDQGEVLVVEVEDNGIGMTEETMADVFTPFFSTKKVWGTGIGMASAYRIINMHGGTIALESELGVGTRFRVTLPVASTSVKQGA
jgi:PAS domain S-box-containing protein